MVAWMLYATAVGVGASVAAWLAERGARRLRRPTRLVWIAAMVLTVGVAAVSLLGAEGGGVSSSSATGTARSGTGDTAILAGWVAVSLLLLASLRLSAWTLRRNARSWRRGVVDGQRVSFSTGFGPGVIGVRSPRIVLPGWLARSPAWLRRLVVHHEREHVRTRDTGLLLAGVLLTVLVPWCVPLWWQLHRLRAAVESDCDARVLAGAVDPRLYARALVAIAGRPTGRLTPVPTLAPRPGELERRIRLITASAGSRRSAPAWLGLAATVLVAAVSLPAPAVRPAPILPTLRVAPPRSSYEPPREATVILSLTPEARPAAQGEGR